MSKHRKIACAVLLLAGLHGASASAAEPDAEANGSMQDLIMILRDRGVIDETDYDEIAAKNAAYEAQKKQDRMPSLSFWGDFRFRSENFWYEHDETGNQKDDRMRVRYRLRLNLKAEINEHAEVYARIVSGDDDLRSTNKTLGNGVDFDTDDLRLTLAYARISPFAHGKLGEDGTLHFELGKVPNPFVWTIGKDFMLWDHDITLEGGSARSTWGVAEGFEVFANAGYYIMDANANSKDPHMVAGQLGFHADATESIAYGARASYYRFDSIDSAFIQRSVDGSGSTSKGGGNIVDGLTGDADGGHLQVAEISAYLKMLTDTDWPVLLYGSYATNMSAEDSELTAAGKGATAWGGGVEIGNKKKYVLLGVGYWNVEANAFPSQFIDSDLFDGFTNRKGWAAYASRTVWKNTDLNISAFFSDDIQGHVPPYGDSVPNAEYIRLQADLVLKFE